MKKKKLSLDEQIDYLKEKGVCFSLISEDDAKKFLHYNNYLFKVKAYARNYYTYTSTDKAGIYIGLDFAYLVELSTLDMYFRKLIVHLCLDVEHVLKTRLLYDISLNEKEDGYQIVSTFLNGNYTVLSSLYGDAECSATGGLIKKFKEHEDEIPVWSFVETLSFGRFIELYTLYYGIYPPAKWDEKYLSYLGDLKFLRNAAAHNTCLLNSLRKPYNGTKIKKTKAIMTILNTIQNKKKVFDSAYKSRMENPVIHDFVVLMFVYHDILNTPANRKARDKGLDEIYHLIFDVFPRHSEYFSKNDVLLDNYLFIRTVATYIKTVGNKKLIRS